MTRPGAKRTTLPGFSAWSRHLRLHFGRYPILNEFFERLFLAGRIRTK
jgi:hypothetical protein